jgi:hypothetical protein
MVGQQQDGGAEQDGLGGRRDEGQALERIGDRRGRREDGRADARARVERDVLGKVEGLEAALLRVPGHRDHLVRVGAVETGVVAEPELHVRKLSQWQDGGLRG